LSAISLREFNSLRLDLREDSSLEMVSLSSVTSGSSFGASFASSDDSSSVAAAVSSTAFSSPLIWSKVVAIRALEGGVITHDVDVDDDVKAQRRAAEAGVKAAEEASSDVKASAAAGRGVMMAVVFVLLVRLHREGRDREIDFDGRLWVGRGPNDSACVTSGGCWSLCDGAVLFMSFVDLSDLAVHGSSLSCPLFPFDGLCIASLFAKNRRKNLTAYLLCCPIAATGDSHHCPSNI
jgi:hypothetical protein